MSEIFIPNKDLFHAPWPEDGRQRWPESYTARFPECGDRGLLADKLEGPDAFSWCGVPGTCYKVNAFLPGEPWNEYASSRFASWKCAVFAPLQVDPMKPVVLLFTGIGGDYCMNGWLVPHIVKRTGCICVAYETHLTGTRGLKEHYASLQSNLNAYNRYHGYEPFGSKAFTCLTRELSFNARQVVELAARIYGLPHRRFITCGFSLGAYYSYQIALSQPTCIGAVGGCGSAIIADYFSLIPRLPYPMPEGVFQSFLPAHLVETIALGTSVFRVAANAYGLDCATAGQIYHFLLGAEDTFTCTLTAQKVTSQEYGGKLLASGAKYNVRVYHAGHEPFKNPEQVGRGEICIGAGMVDAVAQLAVSAPHDPVPEKRN